MLIVMCSFLEISLSLADSTALVLARGRALRAVPPGAMVALRGSEDEVRAFLDRTGAAVDVAGINSPDSTVVAGDPEAVAALEAAWTASGRRSRHLRVRRAFHSRQAEGVLAEFRTALAALAFRRPELPVVSTVTGRLVEPEEMGTPEYWVRQLRETVRFRDAVREPAAQGVGTFVEIGLTGGLS